MADATQRRWKKCQACGKIHRRVSCDLNDLIVRLQKMASEPGGSGLAPEVLGQCKVNEVNIDYQAEPHRVTILLDYGSTTSILSLDLVRRRWLKPVHEDRLKVKDIGGVTTYISAIASVKMTLGLRLVYNTTIWMGDIGEGVAETLIKDGPGLRELGPAGREVTALGWEAEVQDAPTKTVNYHEGADRDKNGVGIRLCIDYRAATLMADRVKLISAFICPLGHFQWLRMPFGLINAPLIYQRCLDNALWEFKCLTEWEERAVDESGEPPAEVTASVLNILAAEKKATAYWTGRLAPSHMGQAPRRGSYIDDIAFGAKDRGELCSVLNELPYRLRYW
ncbi:hypothetical protein PybrP1_008405 [[Pythium] brassicae (nom. inval.)]|nr:hypothetical protein PybrP1_008405 [[Pythium] brassicae (nom. inval.)]